MRLTREGIAAIVPHAGAMCLLDGVTDWDERRIRCVSRTHLDAGNPLRSEGRLPAVCAVEYAAQAMAVHGGLAGSTQGRPRAGYLASLRDVDCLRERLDDLDGELVVEAERLMGDEAHVIYRFSVSIGNIAVVTGRAAVVLQAQGELQ